MPLTAVLMNDTRGHAHFGCQRVMRVIESNLESRGIKILARSLVRNDWEADRAFLDEAAKCDVIVVNGEGTLHHGASHGEKLLRIATHPVRAGKPIALVNAIYQENPEHWRHYLDGIDLISPRDSWSAAALREATGREIEHIPDLSMAEGFHPAADTSVRTMLTIGESVLRDARRELIATFRKRPDAFFLPIVGTIKSHKLRLPQPLRALRKLYVELDSAIFKARNRRAIFAQSEADYVDALLRSTLHVSGRFHAICFALATKTPFLAMSSNAWKIEALFEDMGIDKRRLIRSEQIDQVLSDPPVSKFEPEEMLRIDRAMVAGTQGAGMVFDRIAEIAQLRR